MADQIRAIRKDESLMPIPEGDEVYTLVITRKPIDSRSPLTCPGYHINGEGLRGLSEDAKDQLYLMAMGRAQLKRIGYGGKFAKEVKIRLSSSGIDLEVTM